MSHERAATVQVRILQSYLFFSCAPRWLFVQAFISKRPLGVFINTSTSIGFSSLLGAVWERGCTSVWWFAFRHVPWPICLCCHQHADTLNGKSCKHIIVRLYLITITFAARCYTVDHYGGLSYNWEDMSRITNLKNMKEHHYLTVFFWTLSPHSSFKTYYSYAEFALFLCFYCVILFRFL